MPDKAPWLLGRPITRFSLLLGPLMLSLMGGIGRAAEPDTKTLAAQARGVLKTYCHRCHHGEGSEGGDFDVLKVETLTAPRDGDTPYVVPGKPAESYLYQRLAIRKQGKGDMPPQKIRERPSDADKEAVRQWIEASAPTFLDSKPARKFITLAEVLAAVRDHLRDADEEKQPHLRYFTLHHLANNPAVSEDDLRLCRAALSKALNSLTWSPDIVPVEPVDKAATIFVIDVRDTQWDRDNLWQEILNANPYGLKYHNHPGLRKLNDEINRLSRDALPIVRADWFVATATRPPLYHALLRLPARASQLERDLGVKVIADSFLDPTPELIARGGFARSGVSGQNRLVERHRAQHGAYWKSYDFKPDSARAKLTRFPLGPLGLFPEKEHPFKDQAFRHDGGEIIFNLPNGLQGYLLVNGKDERIEEGPIQVVGDELRTSGTPAIVTGLSCMACHKHGMIPFKDQIRTTHAVFGKPARQVELLYPEAKVMNRLVERDEARFLAALERAVGRFLRVGPDKDKPLKQFPEPVGEVARTYRLLYLDLKTLACELDIEDPKELLQQVGEKKWKQLGLEAVLKPGGEVSRLEWEAVDDVSLMQEVARELRYTPVGTVVR
jgi:serine/threonine-protein kinase